MTRLLRCVVSAAVLLSLFSVSVIEAKESMQSQITSINPETKQIGVLLDSKSKDDPLKGRIVSDLTTKPVTMQVDGATRITMGDQDIAFSDLAVGDTVKITYVEKKGLRGKSYLAGHVEVLEHKTEGAGTVLFVEPQTQSIGVKMGGKTLVLCTSNVTQFQGVESLNDIQANDKIYVEYYLCDDGKNTIKVLKKEAN